MTVSQREEFDVEKTATLLNYFSLAGDKL